MNPVRRFCFHPDGKDRLAWAWIDAVLFLAFCVLAPMSFYKGHPINGSFNVFFLLWNLGFAMLNYSLYRDWKKKQTSI
jgi:hypothetical protein